MNSLEELLGNPGEPDEVIAAAGRAEHQRCLLGNRYHLILRQGPVPLS